MKSGAIEFLWKPFQVNDLIDAIKRGLGIDIENTNIQHKIIHLKGLQAELSAT